MQENVRKYQKGLENAGKYQKFWTMLEMFGKSEKHQKMLGIDFFNAVKCYKMLDKFKICRRTLENTRKRQKMLDTVKKCKKMLKNVLKYKEMTGNAR